MKHFTLPVLVTLSILIFSCTNSNKKQDSPSGDVTTKNIRESPIAADEKNTDDLAGNNGTVADSLAKPQAPGGQQEKKKQQPPQAVPTDWDKKIIKTASINLEVKDYNNYYSSLREKIKALGGYVAQEEQTQSDYKIENNMVIKVPVDQFDNAVVQLTNAQKINERKITSQDVTTEVVDTKSRMEAKKQVRLRYMELLGQAKNMQDILSVQSEINNIQEEIESAAGRVEYLNHSSTFSTINLTYYQVLDSAAKDRDGEKKPSFGEKVKEALQLGWEIVSNLLIVMITIWPLLIGSFIAYLLYKRFRGSKTKA